MLIIKAPLYERVYMMSLNKSFTKEVLDFSRSSFLGLEKDMFGNNRLFFENSGGSLRLESVVEAETKYAAIPDNATRLHKDSLALKEVFGRGMGDLKLFFNAQQGTVAAFHTASQGMFEIVRVISQSAGLGSIVATQLEHPSAFDACHKYGTERGQEVRIAEPNQQTGCVDQIGRASCREGGG